MLRFEKKSETFMSNHVIGRVSLKDIITVLDSEENVIQIKLMRSIFCQMRR